MEICSSIVKPLTGWLIHFIYCFKPYTYYKLHSKVAYYCKLLVLVIRLSLFTHQNGWRLPCEVKPSKTITIVI